MADLQIAPPRERSVLPAVLIAFLALAAVAAAVFYFNPHKVAELQVADVQTFAPHTEMKSLGIARSAGGMRVLNGTQTTAEDDLYVLATVHFTDKLRIPLYMAGAYADVIFADGTEVQPHMVPLPDVDRLRKIFPAMAPLTTRPLADDAEIDPGKTLSGTVVLAFPGRDAAAWKNKRSATLTLELRSQGPQTVPLP